MTPILNDILKDKITDVKESDYFPVIKTVLIGAGVVLVIGLSGYILKVFTFTARNFKEFQNVMRRQ